MSENEKVRENVKETRLCGYFVSYKKEKLR